MLPWSDRKPPRAHRKRAPKPAWLKNRVIADSPQGGSDTAIPAAQAPTDALATAIQAKKPTSRTAKISRPKPVADSRRETGTEWEHRAATWLQEKGLRVVAANVHCRAGEIDLICVDGQTAVIVEVRRRSSASHGSALESIDWHKRRRVIRAALLWWGREGGRRFAHLRFDTVTFNNSAHPDWTRHAFDAEGSI
jgi:putative endonuclease